MYTAFSIGITKLMGFIIGRMFNKCECILIDFPRVQRITHDFIERCENRFVSLIGAYESFLGFHKAFRAFQRINRDFEAPNVVRGVHITREVK